LFRLVRSLGFPVLGSLWPWSILPLCPLSVARRLPSRWKAAICRSN